MIQVNYFIVSKYMKNSFGLHLKMVHMALEEGVSATARAFLTTRRTVCKWLIRYQEEGLDGLVNRSRTPHNYPHKIPAQLEHRIIEIRLKNP